MSLRVTKKNGFSWLSYAFTLWASTEGAPMAEKKKTLLQGTIDVHPHQPGERCVLVPIASGEFCSESQVVTFEVTAILNGQ